MFITAIGPTYRRPALAANMLYLWEQQTHPKDQCHLMICDDGDTYEEQSGENWTLLSPPELEYGYLGNMQYIIDNAPKETEGFVFFHDDDLYWPNYVSNHSDALEQGDFSKPTFCLVHYGTNLQAERRTFWDTLGFTPDLLKRIGGLEMMKIPPFDWIHLARFEEKSKKTMEPWHTFDKSQFCYGWSATGYPHGSTFIANNDDTEYNRKFRDASPHNKLEGRLIAKQDYRTSVIYGLMQSLPSNITEPGALVENVKHHQPPVSSTSPPLNHIVTPPPVSVVTTSQINIVATHRSTPPPYIHRSKRPVN